MRCTPDGNLPERVMACSTVSPMLSMMCARRSMASTSVSGSMSGDDSSSRNSAGLIRSLSVTLQPFSSVPCEHSANCSDNSNAVRAHRMPPCTAIDMLRPSCSSPVSQKPTRIAELQRVSFACWLACTVTQQPEYKNWL